MLLLAACKSGNQHIQRQLEAAQASFDQEQYAAAMQAAQQGAGSVPAGSDFYCRFRLLEAKAAYFAAPDRVKGMLATPCGYSAEVEIERKITLANSLVQEGAAAKAAPLLEAAMRDAEALRGSRLGLEARRVEARRLFATGEPARAEKLLLEIVALARKANDTQALSAALGNLGFLRIRAARYAEAMPFFEETVRLTSARKDIAYLSARNNLGICYSRLGEFDAAIQNQTEAITGFEAKSYRNGMMDALSEAGVSYYYNGDAKQAAAYFERAYKLARPGSETAARIATNLATLLAGRGEWDRAAGFNDQAIAAKRAAGARTLVYNTLASAEIAAGRGDAAAARRLFQEALGEKQDRAVAWRARLGLAALASNAGRTAEARGHFEAALQDVEASRGELEKPDLRLSYFSRLADFYERYVEFLLDQKDADGALSVVESSRAKVLLERSESAAAPRFPAARYRQLAKDLDAVLLSYWLSPRGAKLWIVTPSKVDVVALPARDQVAAWAAEYSAAILNQADPLANRLEAGAKLYEALVKPAPQAKRVVLVPDGPLHSLNFETLPVYDAAKPHYWLEDVELAVTPSLNAMLTAAPHAAVGRKRLLLVGDPVAADSRYPALKNAAREMEAVASHFPEVIRRTGEAATAEAFLSAEPQSAPYIHFTAHAIANRQAPLESAVILSRSMLYARDLLKVRLNAELVAISSCRGAGGRAYVGEGLVGLAWAFLHSGAARVVAGLWDVDDSATADLMGAFYAGVVEGKRPTAALRQAKQQLLQGQRARPYFWGPFQLYITRP